MKRIITTLITAAVLVGPLLFVPVTASADVAVGISVRFGPPPLPYYPQPVCPGIGFIWAPGYWAYDDDGDGYFWVPGTWVLAPAVGLLWTPGWWGWYGGRYWWHPGYWGHHVGYYGGIRYGYGYPGDGYDGGYWDGDDFYYNRWANNIDEDREHWVYGRHDDDGDDDRSGGRISYNGGLGGVNAQPTSDQENFAREQHFAPTESQMEQQRMAKSTPAQHWAINKGIPEIAATTRAGAFGGSGTVSGVTRQPVQRDAPVAHATPGQPSYPRSTRAIAEPVFHSTEPTVRTQPSISHAVAPAMPVFHEPVHHQQAPAVSIGVPHAHVQVEHTTREQHGHERKQVGPEENKKTQHPPR